ncbi:unnamed protein product [Cylicocyclus nassatus]|uniref:Uncharacterized protein n=1 Tax=Cylicocyclus nassatus TaxID=53992 RepID=A0AA36H5Y7_CYLNA|nr:unnamed protein product [Cylicocyclus nassatus]
MCDQCALKQIASPFFDSIHSKIGKVEMLQVSVPYAYVFVIICVVNSRPDADSAATATETLDERIRDFTKVTHLLKDVSSNYDKQENEASKQPDEVVFPMLSLAKHLQQIIDGSSPEVKSFFEKALKLKLGKDLSEKETEAEQAEMLKLVNGLNDIEKDEILKMLKAYEEEANKVGLEDLILSIKE